MEKKSFSELMDRTEKDRLEGEIHLFCNELEEHGYHTIDVSRALFHAGMARIRRVDVTESHQFYIDMKEAIDGILEDWDTVKDRMRERLEREDEGH